MIAEHLGRVDLENCGKLNLPVDDLPHGQLRGGHEYRCYHYEFDYWPTHSEDDFWQNAKAWATFHLESGERVTADRVNVGKPAPGKFVAPVEVWVTPKG